jgi:DNA polymerase-1
MSKDALYLVDGMAFAFRSFFAIRATLTDSKGRPTNAVYGFTRVLMKLLREENPTHVAVVFDAPGKTFRDEQYADYKATRKETPQELRDQFPLMHEVVEAMNLPLLVVPGVEADDVMGTLAKQAAAADMDCVLVTGDKDMLQLVNDRVKVYDPNKGDKGMWYGHDEVVERFGAGPDHVIDALALIGDTADNVPGVKGIGDKTAKKLIGKYNSLEGLYEHIDDLKGKQKENLENDKDQAFFSRELVTIKTDVELDIAPDAMDRKEFEREKLIEVFSALEFHALLEELIPKEEEDSADCDYQLVLDEKKLKALVKEIRAAGKFAIDTETTSVDAMQAKLVGISMSCADKTGYYVPVAHTREAMTIMEDPDDLTTAKELEGLTTEAALKILKPLLEDETIGKIGHNIKYDLNVFARAGVDLRGITMDTMVASYLTDPSRLRHNLDEVSLQYLQRKLIPISDLIGRGAKAVTFDHVPVDQACVYASEDSEVAWRLCSEFEPRLRERKLEKLFEEIELPLISVLARMEQAGITIDPELFSKLHDEIEGRLAGLEETIFELAGEPFKINSPKQLQVILFEKLGLKPIRKTKTGYSTDVDVLEALSHEHPLPEKILEFRMLEKLRGTYVDALPKLQHPETGRIHTSFNQAVAATGRLSSSDPNLQNIPVRNEYGRRIREGFIPGRPDQVLISADYSQIELRIMAHLSGDVALRQAFMEDADIHRDTAARVFGVKPEDVTPEMRRQAKAVNFGVVYGISSFGLARNLGIGNAEAQKFIDAYFKQYPGVRKWLDDTIEIAQRDGYVMTMLQRRRYLPELKSGDHNVRRGAERAAINTPVQGSAADVIKLAMLRLDEALQDYDARMLLQVHDELVVEAAEDQAEDVAAVMRKTMEDAVELEVPMKVDVGIGKNWAEIH